MKRVAAEFKPRWRPGRGAILTLSALAILTLAATIAAGWEFHHVEVLRRELAQLEEARRQRQAAPPQSPAPPYAEDARHMLLERAAHWAPMLRTLENAAVVGVTPTRVEFDATDDTAHVELAYSNTVALFDYLDRLNAGLPAGDTVGRWKLTQTHAQTNGVIQANGSASSVAASSGVASIQSTWR